jgi:RNA polymerase sigma-70 factor, ECF subfamily
VEEPDPRDVRAAMAGDDDAFERLVRAYATPVWRYLRRLVADDALAEDLAQETFLRVHRRLSAFSFSSKFSTWVFAVARNAGIDALRTRARRDRLREALPPPPAPAGPDVGIELATALASLAPSLREAVLLVEVLGLTYRETAEVVGVAEGTVKSRVFRAREQLTAWMSEADGVGDV